MSQLNNHINHIAFVVDASGSMSHLTSKVINIFDRQIETLSRQSQHLNQETRVSVYLFGGFGVRCVVFDKDVLRLPSLRGLYSPGGGTPLIDATAQSIMDLEKTCQLYGDHAFLIYVITDGDENISTRKPEKLSRLIQVLTENWTLAAFVPDAKGLGDAHRAGFPVDNIVIWDATSVSGLEHMDRTMVDATSRFMQARSLGIRGTRSLFKLDASHLTKKEVKKNLVALRENEFIFVTNGSYPKSIRDIVEVNVGQPYRKGSAYYQLVKPELIQEYKKFCIRDRANQKVYTGDAARDLLGLPAGRAKVTPEHLGKFDVFVQSTSVNRKIPAHTSLIVLN
jgi:hypothetical protein